LLDFLLLVQKNHILGLRLFLEVERNDMRTTAEDCLDWHQAVRRAKAIIRTISTTENYDNIIIIKEKSQKLTAGTGNRKLRI
jgi:hypothetical protein